MIMEYMAELTTYKFPPLEERIQEFEKMNVDTKISHETYIKVI
jgi:hypothetical protein